MTAPDLFLSVMAQDPTQEENCRQYRLCDYTFPTGTVFQVAYLSVHIASEMGRS